MNGETGEEDCTYPAICSASRGPEGLCQDTAVPSGPLTFEAEAYSVTLNNLCFGY